MVLKNLILLAQESDIAAQVREQTQGNAVPPSAIEHEGSYWFPEQASTFAPGVDGLYMYIFWLSTIFFVAIVWAMVYFCIKYRRKGDKIEVEPSPSHNTMIEVIWSVVPSFFLLYIFWVGAEGYFEMRVPTEDAEEIQVRAFRWNWEFTYPDGDVSSELHLVLDRPTKLVMRSDDVLHSMYIPAFRQKMDVVPGRYTYAYLTPNKPGMYRLACTEYCGDEHSKMRTMCKVHLSDEDRKASTEWIYPEHPAWENGERLFKINCSGCHKVDGTAATGPALNLIWDTEEKLSYGKGGRSSVKVDENYIRSSILNPDQDIVAGYTGPPSKMNSFQGKLSDVQIDYLIAYIKYLKTGVSEEPAEAAEGETTTEEPTAEAGGGEDAAAEATEDETTTDDGDEGN